MDVQVVQTFLTTTAIDVGIKIAAAIAFWIVGRWIIARVITIMQSAMQINSVDPTLTKYLGSVLNVTLNIALVIGILGDVQRDVEHRTQVLRQRRVDTVDLHR